MHCDIWSITRDFLVFDGLRYIGSLEASHGVVWPVGMTLFFFLPFSFLSIAAFRLPNKVGMNGDGCYQSTG